MDLRDKSMNNNCILTKAIPVVDTNANISSSHNMELGAITTINGNLNGNGAGNGHIRVPVPLIMVRDGHLRYGKKVVLNNLNMNVEQGSIYALLGSSGCGKTTILSCVVGIRTLTSGDIEFEGQNLRNIIAARGGLRDLVGYMPQELALYKDFTITNALFYFGRIFQMSEKDIKKQAEFLVDLLNLPKADTEIKHMSGGEQRRTSFAVALLHTPKLLILDEPTVGVDPLLRQHIWEHLVKLAVRDNITVIITTHYMEEARAANSIGIMRKGSILAEGPPAELLTRHNCINMDDLFLKLSVMDESKRQAICVDSTDKRKVVAMKRKSVPSLGFSKKLLPLPGVCKRLYALIMKNFLYIWRQLIFIFFLLFFPGIQLALCCYALGGEPYNLPFGVINHELATSNLTSCEYNDLLILQASVNDTNETTAACDQMLLSCRYTKALIKHPTLQLNLFPDASSALEQVRQGLSWGFLEFPPNFTELSMQKAAAGLYADNATVFSSRVRVQMDLSNHYIAASIQYLLYQQFELTMKTILRECEPTYVPEVIDPPISFDEPIYGRHKPTLTEYMSPGLILIIMFFTALSITGINYIIEKREGMLERTIVAGVSTTEVITAQLLTHYATIIIQICICLAILIGVFNIHIQGPIGGVMLLIFLQGSLGMFAGFLLSSVCDEEKVVMQWTACITIPCLILAGIVWPLAAMPAVLRYIAYIFIPQTFACESLRSMITRGWGMTHPDVWPGFAVTMAWLIVLWFTALIFARRGVYK